MTFKQKNNYDPFTQHYMLHLDGTYDCVDRIVINAYFILDNEIKRFYLSSVQRTHDRTHARLNTQRKILTVMLSIWKKGTPYRAELFLDPSI